MIQGTGATASTTTTASTTASTTTSTTTTTTASTTSPTSHTSPPSNFTTSLSLYYITSFIHYLPTSLLSVPHPHHALDD